ncbi:hypothetical protein, partial [Bacillus toyonensis]
PEDHHDNFERRIQNYLVGRTSVILQTPREIQLGRERSVDILASLFDRPGSTRIQQVIGRMRKLTEEQAIRLREELQALKREARK